MTEVVEIALPELRELWRQRDCPLRWPCLFTLPAWLEAWCETLGAGVEPHLQAVRSGGKAIGVAPLRRDGDTVRFLGAPEVFDYQDLVLAPGREAEALAALWDALARDGVARLDLGRLRPDSQVLTHLAPMARQRGAQVEIVSGGASVELVLPGSWEEYLATLGRKQRHELRRKLRRLHAAGPVRFDRASSATEAEGCMGEFFALFRANRADKAAFLAPPMEAYFEALIIRAARDELLNMGLLQVGGVLAAAVLCFDHGGRTHLYNNGYRKEYGTLSVGLLSKVLSLRDSLERGMGVYDLLAGDEGYKLQLGGAGVPLARVVVSR